MTEEKKDGRQKGRGKRFVIAGGPCTGKTTILEELEWRGYSVQQEAARRVIGREQRKNHLHEQYSPVVPWDDPVTFQEKVARQQTIDESVDEQILFLDRGKYDGLGYAKANNKTLPGHILDEIVDTHYDAVFFLDTIPVHETDHQRKETIEQGKIIHNALYEAYDKSGCYIIKVPATKGGVKERVDFVEQKVKEMVGRHRECETKNKISEPKSLEEKMALEGLIFESRGREENNVYNIFGLLNLGVSVRLRRNHGYLLTIKGPTKEGTMNDRPEWNIPLGDTMYKFLRGVLKPFHRASYDKYRITYHPMGDHTTKVNIDRLEATGNYFVEVESHNEEQVHRWKTRLGILGENIRMPYYKIAKECSLVLQEVGS